MIPTLKELYESNKDIKESDIPVKWKESFLDFMMGQSYYKDQITNESMYYSFDFGRWYYQNRIQIERDIKIDDIIK